MTPLVSILMPVHNGAAYLKEAMASILTQSLGDFEFLIVDDASTDQSPLIVKSFPDSRIRLITSPTRLKLSGALNLGLDNATGRYVARMDADDISLPHRLETQVAFLETHPEIGLCGSAIRYFGIPGRTVLTKPADHESIRAFTLIDTPFSHPTVVLRRDWINRNALRFNGDYFPTEDFELWTRALEHGKGANLPDVLLNYRVHGHSLTGSDWSTMDEQAGRIITSRLAPLGITPTSDELRFHRQLAMGRLSMNRALLDQAEHWLTRLVAANRTSRTFEPRALEDVLNAIWFRACMHTARLGFWVSRRYAESELSQTGLHPDTRRWQLRAAALKGKLT